MFLTLEKKKETTNNKCIVRINDISNVILKTGIKDEYHCIVVTDSIKYRLYYDNVEDCVQTFEKLKNILFEPNDDYLLTYDQIQAVNM